MLAVGAAALSALDLRFIGTALAQTPSQADLAVEGPLGDVVQGKADAPVTIIEYASMTCGHCANFHNNTYPELKKKYIDTGKVRYILREFPLDPLAAVLSYLIPGLGQVMQGRIGKGVLFFVCLYGLFFYGMWLGKMKNVWLPDATTLPDVEAPLAGKLSGVPKALAYRPQFLGQFWIGVAAWPAVLQYAASDPATWHCFAS